MKRAVRSMEVAMLVRLLPMSIEVQGLELKAFSFELPFFDRLISHFGLQFP